MSENHRPPYGISPETFGTTPSSVAAGEATEPIPVVTPEAPRAEPKDVVAFIPGRPDLQGRHAGTVEGFLPGPAAPVSLLPRGTESVTASPGEELQALYDERELLMGIARQNAGDTSPEGQEKYDRLWDQIRAVGDKIADHPMSLRARRIPPLAPTPPPFVPGPAVSPKDPNASAFFDDQPTPIWVADDKEGADPKGTPKVSKRLKASHFAYEGVSKVVGGAVNRLGNWAERFSKLETKHKVVAVLGGVAATAAVTAAILVAHKLGASDQINDIIPTPTPKANVPTAEVSPTPTPLDTGGAEDALKPGEGTKDPVQNTVTEHVSKAARRIKPGEGWYTTLKELDIPKKEWNDLLNNDELRDKLIKNGDAYVMADGSLGLNDNPDHKLGMDSIRDIQEAAGIDTAPDASVPEKVEASPDDGDNKTIEKELPEPVPTPDATAGETVTAGESSGLPESVYAIGALATITVGGIALGRYYAKNTHSPEARRTKKSKEKKLDALPKEGESLANWLFSHPEDPFTKAVDAFAQDAVKEEVNSAKDAEEFMTKFWTKTRLNGYWEFVDHFDLRDAYSTGFSDPKDVEHLKNVIKEVQDAHATSL